MLPKYMLTDESRIVNGARVYRIRALRDFRNVKEGELGGWLESEENLSHEGDCWVEEEAVVWDNARVSENARVQGYAHVQDKAQVSGEGVVSGNARVSENAQISGNAQIRGEVSGNAHVHGNARVVENAQVSENAVVSGNAVISGEAQVSGEAHVSGNAKVTRHARVFGGTWNISPSQIWGSRHFLTQSSPGHITIGCVTHPISHWLSEARNIGKKHGYTEQQIDEYLDYVARIRAIERRANASKVYAD